MTLAIMSYIYIFFSPISVLKYLQSHSSSSYLCLRLKQLTSSAAATIKPIIDNNAEPAKLIKQYTELRDSSLILHNN